MRLPLYLNPGATFRLPIEWNAGGLPVDTTGMVLSLEVRDSQGTALFSYSSTDIVGNIVLGLGTVALWISDEDTELMRAARSYRLAVAYPNGDVGYLLEGPIVVGAIPAGRNGIVVVERDLVRIVSQGVQGPPGPPGDDLTGIIDGGTFN